MSEEGTPISIDSFTPEQKGFVQSNFRDFTIEDYAKDPSMANYGSMDDMIKSSINSQQMVGKRMEDHFPNENWDENQLNEFHGKLGWSNDPNNYNLDLSGEIEFNDTNTHLNNSADKFKDWAIKNHISPDQARSLWKDMIGDSINAIDEHTTTTQARRKEGMDEIRKELGDKFKPEAEAGKNTFAKVFGDDFMKLLKETGMSKEPEVLRAAIKLSKYFKEDGISPIEKGTHPLSANQAGAKAAKMLSDREHPLNIKSHEQHNNAVKQYLKFREIEAGGGI